MDAPLEICLDLVFVTRIGVDDEPVTIIFRLGHDGIVVDDVGGRRLVFELGGRLFDDLLDRDRIAHLGVLGFRFVDGRFVYGRFVNNRFGVVHRLHLPSGDRMNQAEEPPEELVDEEDEQPNADHQRDRERLSQRSTHRASAR